MNELIITSKDRVGLLADILAILDEHDISVNLMSVDAIGDEVRFTLQLSNFQLGERVLKMAGYSATIIRCTKINRK